jgi:translation initiation factor 1 (eIF-1/SUI1)
VHEEEKDSDRPGGDDAILARRAAARVRRAGRGRGASTNPAAAGTRRRAGSPSLSRRAKVVVRRERKGHGGKTVTVIDGLDLSPAQLDAVARRMRKAFGCGSWVAGGCVVLQGDFGPAAEAWLRRQGAARVVQAN